MEVSSFHFQASSWHSEFIGDVGLVSCCLFGGEDVGRSMPWHAECFRRVFFFRMFRSWFLAIHLLFKKGRPRAEEKAPIGSAGTPTRKRTSVQAKETGYGTERPNRSVPGQRGVDSRLAAWMRETERNRIGTEQSEFQGTPIAFDERGHLHDSDGSKTLKTILIVLGSSKGRTTRRIQSLTWEPRGGWPQQEVDTVDTESKDKLRENSPWHRDKSEDGRAVPAIFWQWQPCNW